ncbi:hypothetical protein LTR85_010059 [Meristemomyces frigidus]|nr:hypothetical protein LTR85_010059 [Meristemomyces frigidus]
MSTLSSTASLYPTKHAFLTNLKLVTLYDIKALGIKERSCCICRTAFQRIHFYGTTGEIPVRVHGPTGNGDEHYVHEECIHRHCEMQNRCPLCSLALLPQEVKTEDEDEDVKTEVAADDWLNEQRMLAPRSFALADDRFNISRLRQIAAVQGYKHGAQWYDANDASTIAAVRSAWAVLRSRVDLWREGKLELEAVDPNLPRYQKRAVPLHSVPRRSQHTRTTAYAGELRANFMSGTMIVNGKFQAVFTHPLATVACNTISRALEKLDGKTLDAVTFAARLESAVNREPLFDNLHARCCNGELPSGLQAFVADMVETSLKWFVGATPTNRDGSACRRMKCRERGCGCVGVARVLRKSTLAWERRAMAVKASRWFDLEE